jgi:hypothetical protein
MNKIIYTGWMGPGSMSINRESALHSIYRNTCCPTALLTPENLGHWIRPEFPIHAAFPYLSAVHQCDYLRCYVLHVYGGGYTDIKHTEKNWSPFFDRLYTSDAFGIGYTEIGEQGIAKVGGNLEKEMKQNYEKIIGVCAMIFKPQTEFTHEWFTKLHDLLDKRLEILKSNPARHPQDRIGAEFTDGSISQYPFAWTEVGGDIFHPLAYKYHANILHDDIAPSFSNYR